MTVELLIQSQLKKIKLNQGYKLSIDSTLEIPNLPLTKFSIHKEIYKKLIFTPSPLDLKAFCNIRGGTFRSD